MSVFHLIVFLKILWWNKQDKFYIGGRNLNNEMFFVKNILLLTQKGFLKDERRTNILFKKKKDDIKCKNVLQTTGTIGTC